MLGTVETHLAYVPLSEIDVTETPYHFRLESREAPEMLAASLLRSGQNHPAILIELEPGRYQILDGHHRVAAMAHIQKSGGVWEKIWAQVLPAEGLSSLHRFRLLRERNMRGENPYGLVETGRFLRAFLKNGVSLETVAEELGLGEHEVDDVAEMALVSPLLSPLLNGTHLPASFAVVMHRRFDACLRSPWAEHAPRLAAEILTQAGDSHLTLNAWRFLLDFYWGTKHPFLLSSAKTR